MEASTDRFKVRPVVVDFLGTLFVTFCIGVATALVLGACVVLMASEARGAGRAGEPAKVRRTSELVLTHTLVTKYASLVAIDRSQVAAQTLRSARGCF